MAKKSRLKTLLILIVAVILIHIVIIRMLVKSSAESNEQNIGSSASSENVLVLPEPEMRFK